MTDKLLDILLLLIITIFVMALLTVVIGAMTGASLP